MELLVVLSVLVAAGLAARFWGADTRDGKDWQPLDTRRGCFPSCTTR